MDNQTSYKNIAIFAGNSRILIDENNGGLIVQPQLAAFKAAVMRAAELHRNAFEAPFISIAFDHPGVFNRFLKPGLPHSQQRHPRLSQLQDEVTVIFAPLAEEAGISMDDIHVIREDNAKNHASYMLDKGQCSVAAARLMRATEKDEDEEDSAPSCASRVTCAAIGYEYFNKSITKDTKLLELFYENDHWMRPGIVVNSIQLLEDFGSKAEIELCLVDKNTGKIARARHKPR